jgi:uncharacterized protein
MSGTRAVGETVDPSWWAVPIAGLFVGFVVGLTGMGGGALMTPVMVLLFGVQPLAAVSSDLVASMIMKPVGGIVHLRRGTVNRGLVKWLVLGSVPAAFIGVLVLRASGDSEATQTVVKTSLGVALLLAAGSMVAKAMLDLRKKQLRRRASAAGLEVELPVESVTVRPLPTLLIGACGGLVVGMTSVGSGSLMIVALLLLYPSIRAGQLVGTDLVQAVPLVASASLGHLLFGDFRLGLTASLLVGALPGVYLGARVSSAAPGGIVRRALVVVLLASGLKLLDVGNGPLVVVMAVVALVATALWTAVYRATRDDAETTRRELLRAAVTGRRHRRKPAAVSQDRAGDPER